MLKRITFNNFKTFFNKPTSIDFTKTNYKFLEDTNVYNDVLKGALFVGENALGKTNILDGITILFNILFSNSEIDYNSYSSFYTDNSYFSIDYLFEIDDVDVNYFFKIDSSKIVEEKLLVGEKECIRRIGNSAIVNINNQRTFNDLSDKVSFIRRVYFDTGFYDDKILNDWFSFLKRSIILRSNEKDIICSEPNMIMANDFLNKYGTDRINAFFKEIGYKESILYDYETPTTNIYKIKNDKEKILFFKKDGTNQYIPSFFESNGNKSLISTLPSFLKAIDNECMIVVDEFSSGLHNELEECVLKYFFTHSKTSQVFLTSHSTNLLNNALMRPDQIYAVSFSSKKGTILHRFSDESPRQAQNIEKMYLNGTFGGLPKYKKFFKI
ncbi:MAG: ATP-binding protein [Firmicutes bacterium]|nr:ATP-binding protein [Candidatus Colivicinus equi]